MLVDVGGENLDARDPLQPVHVLAQEHCNGISLLARRATRHPYTHRIVRAATVETLWYDPLGKRFERPAVPKDGGDRTILGEGKRVSVRVSPGGSRLIQKKKQT